MEIFRVIQNGVKGLRIQSNWLVREELSNIPMPTICHAMIHRRLHIDSSVLA